MTHDSRLMNETGRIRIIREAARADGRAYTVFGDAAFGSTNVVQCMVKSVYHPDDSSFNAIMSRFRVHLENAFAGQRYSVHVSQFLQEQQNGLTQRPSQFIVAAIFMSILTTLYGNQFTHELGYRLRISLMELMELAN